MCQRVNIFVFQFELYVDQHLCYKFNFILVMFVDAFFSWKYFGLAECSTKGIGHFNSALM